MATGRIAAAGAMLALVSGCYDSPGNSSNAAATPAATPAAATGDCPGLAPAPPPAGPILLDQTMIGQALKVPAPPPPLQVAVVVRCVAAGTTITKHKHPWQRYVYLESGSVTVTFDFPVPQVKTFNAGDLLVESTDTWHSAQVGDAPARMIVIDQVPATNPPTSNQIDWPGQ